MYRLGIFLALVSSFSVAQDAAEVVADSVVSADAAAGDSLARNDEDNSSSVENAATSNDSTNAVATPEAAEAVIVDEEDIFSEISKQGIQLDAQGESLIDEQPAPEVVVEEEPKDTVAPVAAPLTDSLVQSPEDVVDQQSTPAVNMGKSGPNESAQTVVSAPDSTPAPPPEPARIDDVRSVNFARNLEDYRSPKLAMFLSLMVPGLGQAYARNYWKTALFGVIELSVIGVSIGYNVAGRNATDDAHDYADKHYDTGDTLFRRYYDDLRTFLDANNSDTSMTTQELLDQIYYTPEGQEFLQYYEQHAAGHTDNFYDMIESKQFVQGWDDCAPVFDTIDDAGPNGEIVTENGTFVVHPVADSAYLVFMGGLESNSLHYGYSEYQNTYGNMLSDASTYYRTSTNVLLLLLVNHIASAIDAGITAKRYNDRLLGKQSLWQRLEIQQRFVHTGRDVVPGYSLCIRF